MKTRCTYKSYIAKLEGGPLTYSKQCGAHVVLHVEIVEGHDLDETLQRCNAHLCVEGLGRLTHDLHDEVALRL